MLGTARLWSGVAKQHVSGQLIYYKCALNRDHFVYAAEIAATCVYKVLKDLQMVVDV